MLMHLQNKIKVVHESQILSPSPKLKSASLATVKHDAEIRLPSIAMSLFPVGQVCHTLTLNIWLVLLPTHCKLPQFLLIKIKQLNLACICINDTIRLLDIKSRRKVGGRRKLFLVCL